MNKLEIIDLKKSYGNVKALNSVSLTLENGIYGFVGHNGAGKSTLLKVLTTILKPDSGEVLYNGESIENNEDYRSELGYMPQSQVLPGYMTIERFLYYISALKGLSKKEVKVIIDDLLNQLNLSEKRHHKLSSLSGGMKQRVLIAQTLLNQPSVIFLDEPTAGLDPVQRSNLREFLTEISNNRIIILATHIISDIEYIADKVLLLQKGKIVKFDSQEGLLEKLDVYESLMSHKVFRVFKNNNKIVNSIRKGEMMYVRHFDSTIEGDKVTATLEDVYLHQLS